MATRVLILGGTGSTGKALVRHLQSDGRPVEISIVSRTARAMPGVTRVITGHYADLARDAAFAQHLANSDVIVHLGDGLGILQERAHASDAPLAGRLIAASESVARAAREVAAPRFVYVSSIKALCDESDDRILVESSTPHPTTAYGRAKLQLEQAIGAAFAGSTTRLVVLRNPVMYSPGKKGSLHRLLQLADTPMPLPFGDLTNKRSLLAVRNFASALATVVRAGPDGPSGVFHIHDGPPLSTTEIMEILRAALNRPRRLFAVGGLASVARHTPLLAPTARRLYGSLQLSDAALRSSFGWAPIVSTQLALAEIAASRPEEALSQ